MNRVLRSDTLGRQKRIPPNLIKSVAIMTCLTFIWPMIGWAFNGQTYPIAQGGLHAFAHFKKPLVLSQEIGKIKSHHQGNKQTVIVIEDLHCHYEVQKNISKIIDHFVKQESLSMVGVEGATGPIDLGVLTNFPVPSIRELAAHYFMEQGKLTGAEYYAAQSDQPINLVGIESAKTYQAAFTAVNSFLNNESQGLYYDLKDQLTSLKPMLYNKALKRFDQDFVKYQSGQMSTLKYGLHLKKWLKQVGQSWQAFPALEQLVSISRSNKKADFNHENLIQEFEAIDKQIRSQLYTHQDQRQLDELLTRLNMIERLLSISVTPSQWQAYQQNRAAYKVDQFLSFANRFNTNHVLHEELFRLDYFLNQVELFYQLADRRSLEFVNNLKQTMINQDQELAIMISGGFHKDQVLTHLQQQGMSYITIRPTMTKTDLINPYFSILQGKLLPLEKLLLNNQTNMAPQVWSQARPNGYEITTTSMVSAIARSMWGQFSRAQRQAANWVQETWQEIKGINLLPDMKAYRATDGTAVLFSGQLRDQINNVVSAVISRVGTLTFFNNQEALVHAVSGMSDTETDTNLFSKQNLIPGLLGIAYMTMFIIYVIWAISNGMVSEIQGNSLVVKLTAGVLIGLGIKQVIDGSTKGHLHYEKGNSVDGLTIIAPAIKYDGKSVHEFRTITEAEIEKEVILLKQAAQAYEAVLKPEAERAFAALSSQEIMNGVMPKEMNRVMYFSWFNDTYLRSDTILDLINNKKGKAADMIRAIIWPMKDELEQQDGDTKQDQERLDGGLEFANFLDDCDKYLQRNPDGDLNKVPLPEIKLPEFPQDRPFVLVLRNPINQEMDKFMEKYHGQCQAVVWDGKYDKDIHWAGVLAAKYNIPVCGNHEQPVFDSIRPQDTIVVDVDEHEILVNPNRSTLQTYRFKQIEQAAVHAVYAAQAGSKANIEESERSVAISAVVGDVPTEREAKDINRNAPTGIGLFRTEYLYMENTPPTEEALFQTFLQTADRIDGQVSIRALDRKKDDKDMQAFPETDENGFDFLCNSGQQAFKTQCRAILRAYVASERKNLRYFVPMVSTELQAKAALLMLNETREELISEYEARLGLAEDERFTHFRNTLNNFQFGVMIETKGAVENLEAILTLEEIDFISVGTRDLREVYKKDEDYLPTIKTILNGAEQYHKPVSLCGEYAADRAVILSALQVSKAQENGLHLALLPALMPDRKAYIRAITSDDLKVEDDLDKLGDHAKQIQAKAVEKAKSTDLFYQHQHRLYLEQGIVETLKHDFDPTMDRRLLNINNIKVSPALSSNSSPEQLSHLGHDYSLLNPMFRIAAYIWPFRGKSNPVMHFLNQAVQVRGEKTVHQNVPAHSLEVVAGDGSPESGIGWVSGTELGFDDHGMELIAPDSENASAWYTHQGSGPLVARIYGMKGKAKHAFRPLPKAMMFKIVTSQELADFQVKKSIRSKTTITFKKRLNEILEENGALNQFNQQAMVKNVFKALTSEKGSSFSIGIWMDKQNQSIIEELISQLGISENYDTLAERIRSQREPLSINGTSGELVLYPDDNWSAGLSLGKRGGVDLVMGFSRTSKAMVSAVLVKKMGGAFAGFVMPHQDFPVEDQANWQEWMTWKATRGNHAIFDQDDLVLANSDDIACVIGVMGPHQLGIRSISGPEMKKGIIKAHSLWIGTDGKVYDVTAEIETKLNHLLNSQPEQGSENRHYLDLTLTYAQFGMVRQAVTNLNRIITPNEQEQIEALVLEHYLNGLRHLGRSPSSISQAERSILAALEEWERGLHAIQVKNLTNLEKELRLNREMRRLYSWLRDEKVKENSSESMGLAKTYSQAAIRHSEYRFETLRRHNALMLRPAYMVWRQKIREEWNKYSKKPNLRTQVEIAVQVYDQFKNDPNIVLFSTELIEKGKNLWTVLLSTTVLEPLNLLCQVEAVNAIDQKLRDEETILSDENNERIIQTFTDIIEQAQELPEGDSRYPFLEEIMVKANRVLRLDQMLARTRLFVAEKLHQPKTLFILKELAESAEAKAELLVHLGGDLSNRILYLREAIENYHYISQLGEQELDDAVMALLKIRELTEQIFEITNTVVDSKLADQAKKRVSDIETFEQWAKQYYQPTTIAEFWRHLLEIEQLSSTDTPGASIAPLKKRWMEKRGWSESEYQRHAWWVEGRPMIAIGVLALAALITQYTGLMDWPLWLAPPLFIGLVGYWQLFLRAHQLDEYNNDQQDIEKLPIALRLNYMLAKRLSLNNNALLAIMIILAQVVPVIMLDLRVMTDPIMILGPFVIFNPYLVFGLLAIVIVSAYGLISHNRLNRTIAKSAPTLNQDEVAAMIEQFYPISGETRYSPPDLHIGGPFPQQLLDEIRRLNHDLNQDEAINRILDIPPLDSVHISTVAYKKNMGAQIEGDLHYSETIDKEKLVPLEEEVIRNKPASYQGPMQGKLKMTDNGVIIYEITTPKFVKWVQGIRQRFGIDDWHRPKIVHITLARLITTDYDDATINKINQLLAFHNQLGTLNQKSITIDFIKFGQFISRALGDVIVSIIRLSSERETKQKPNVLLRQELTKQRYLQAKRTLTEGDISIEPETLLLQVLTQDEQSANAHLLLGNLYVMRGQAISDKPILMALEYQQAIGHFKDALTINQEMIEAYIGLYHIYSQLDRQDDAVEMKNEIIQRLPKGAKVDDLLDDYTENWSTKPLFGGMMKWLKNYAVSKGWSTRQYQLWAALVEILPKGVVGLVITGGAWLFAGIHDPLQLGFIFLSYSWAFFGPLHLIPTSWAGLQALNQWDFKTAYKDFDRQDWTNVGVAFGLGFTMLGIIYYAPFSVIGLAAATAIGPLLHLVTNMTFLINQSAQSPISLAVLLKPNAIISKGYFAGHVFGEPTQQFFGLANTEDEYKLAEHIHFKLGWWFNYDSVNGIITIPVFFARLLETQPQPGFSRLSDDLQTRLAGWLLVGFFNRESQRTKTVALFQTTTLTLTMSIAVALTLFSDSAPGQLVITSHALIILTMALISLLTVAFKFLPEEMRRRQSVDLINNLDQNLISADEAVKKLNLLYSGPLIKISQNNLMIRKELLESRIGWRLLKLLRNSLPDFIEPERNEQKPHYYKRFHGLAGSA